MQSVNPRCSKCDAEVSEFLVWKLPSAEGNLVLVYCGRCGAVQGVVRAQEPHKIRAGYI
jgi:uncharacterized Zn finger protein